MQKLRSVLRKSFIACCLALASSLCGPIKVQRKALFQSLLEQADALAWQAARQGIVQTWLVSVPLRLALHVRRTQSVRRGIAACWREPLARPAGMRPPSMLNPASAAHDADARLAPMFAAPPVSIAGYAHRLHGEDAFAGHTVVVLAVSDADGGIDDLVRPLLEHFRWLTWKVVISSRAKPVNDDSPLVAGFVYRTCGGDAFTAWKAALHCFPSLLQARDVILCHDGVLGPIGSVWPMHEATALLPCDFWGATYSPEPVPHLQDFYLVFRRTALEHPAFASFFDKVPLSGGFEEPEIPGTETTPGMLLALWLEHHGLRSAAFTALPSRAAQSSAPLYTHWKTCLEAGVPFMSKALLFRSPLLANIYKWPAVLRDRGFPLQPLFTHGWKAGVDLTPRLCDGHRAWQWPADVLTLQDPIDLDGVDSAALPDNMPPLGLFLHVYYVQLLPELAAYLHHFPRTAHVYVSTDTEDKAADIYAAWGKLGFARMEVRVLPNRGWDIAPFLLGFTDVLEQYPLIVRLHAKASRQLPTDVSQGWRETLFSSLAGSPDRVRRLTTLFVQHPELGMIVPPPVPWYAANIDMAGNYEAMRRLLEPCGIQLAPDTAIDFPMGSMFWCRSEVLRPWLRQNLRFEDFEPSCTDVVDGSLAHALERLFLFGCGIAGKRWGRVPPDGYNRLSPHMPFVQAAEGRTTENRADVVEDAAPGVASPHAGGTVTVLPAGERPELVLILPFIHPRYFSGGPNTALLFAAEAAKAGYSVHCISESPPTCSSDCLREHLRVLLDLDGPLADRFRVSSLSYPLRLHENDRLLATAWGTATLAHTLGQRMSKQRFGYFIQDFEPLFNPWNEYHAKAMLTYGYNCLPIINEPSLAQFFFMLQPGRFADSAFRAAVQVFMPAVDRRWFHPEARTGKHTLLFYARPVQERNLYRCGKEAIWNLVQEGLLEAHAWNVHLMGDDSLQPIDFGRGVVSRTLPWMGFADYAAHIRQASVGLSLMLSPHTSYMPLELAAAGVPVVTSTYLNKNAEELRRLSPQIIGVEPTVGGVTHGLRVAVRLAAQTPSRTDRLAAPATWPDAFAPIMPRFLHFMETGE